jgi:NADPH-dependent 2,4-dienoyl-CoA reductase/sulfur reductase-like enzyme
VNPRAGRDADVTRQAATPRSLLVIGGGPAGTELAALAAERGHHVQLWERGDALGGQLAVAALARMNARYADWITWQSRRLGLLGVDGHLGRDATADAVLAAATEIVAFATGATPRRSEVPGADLPFVITAADALTGRAEIGHRVLVVSEDDRAAPLVVAEHLAGAGHDVTLIYRTTAPSPLVGKYTIGAILGRLDAAGATLVPVTRLVGIEAGRVHLANSYSNRRFPLDGVDTVVLACGSIPDDGLFHEVRTRHPRTHLLGDAFAPRRMVSATRQAWELAQLLD